MAQLFYPADGRTQHPDFGKTLQSSLWQIIAILKIILRMAKHGDTDKGNIMKEVGVGSGARDEPPWRNVNKARLSKFTIETLSYQMTV